MYQDLFVITESNYTHYEFPLIELYCALSKFDKGERYDNETIKKKIQKWLAHKDNTVVVYKVDEKLVGLCAGYSGYCEREGISSSVKNYIDINQYYFISELAFLPEFQQKSCKVQLLEYIIFTHSDNYSDFLVRVAKECPELTLYEDTFQFKRLDKDHESENFIFLHLEQKIKCIGYLDLLKTQVKECNEELVKADYFDSSIILKESEINLFPCDNSQENWLVRKEVAQKLAYVNKKLMNLFGHLCVYISSGLRNSGVQDKVFYKYRDALAQKRQTFTNLYDFIEEINQHIAVPTVAGHLTGGAVDITIYDTSREATLDMGSLMYELLSDKISWKAKSLTYEQQKNRMLLYHLMVSEEFAPTMSKWWQFSYGDRQWAVYYNKPHAIYDIRA
jgi:D-alanyl-D-alanine dipeptidase